MAQSTPNGPNHDKKPEKKPDQPNAGNLPEWLRTDDWLQITPPPLQQPIVEHLSSTGTPGDEQVTEMIELDDEDPVGDPPPSTMLFSDPDDSVVLMDEIQISGPLSGILQASGSPSSLRMPIDPAALSKDIVGPLSATNDSSQLTERNSGSDDSIDLSQLPQVDRPLLSGPPTSRTQLSKPLTTRTPIIPVSPDDVLGQPLTPTGPASGWLGSATNLPKVTPVQPAVPPIAVGPETVKSPIPASSNAPPTPVGSDSWHPSSGNINTPSMGDIDLPPTSSSDIFGDSARIGNVIPVAKLELPKPIEQPKKPIAEAPKATPVKVEPPKPAVDLPATGSANTWGTLPSLPSQNLPGSWHPSSGSSLDHSYSEIDLPPDASMGAGKGVSRDEILKAEALQKGQPTPLDPASISDISAIPLNIEPTTPGSGWLAGPSTQPKASIPFAPTPLSSVDLKLPSDALIDVPPQPVETDANDIFSTARRPDGSLGGGSALFSGAIAPGSDIFTDRPGQVPGDSHVLTELPVAPRLPTIQSKTIQPVPQHAESEIDLSTLLQDSPSAAISFALPRDGTGSSPSSVEIIDTSGAMDNLAQDQASKAPAQVPDANAIPEPKFGEASEATLDDFLRDELLSDDEGKPDFDILHSGLQSDSNLLGDRTFVEASLQEGPQSSGINLGDPDRFDLEQPETGVGSSIFNKVEQPSQLTGGRIDIDEIPLMGSSDEGTDAIFDASSSAVMGGRLDASSSSVMGGRLDAPKSEAKALRPEDLEESVFEVDLTKDLLADDSGRIDWASDPDKLTNRLGIQQPTMESTQRSALPLDESDEDVPIPVPVTPRPKKPVVSKPKSSPQFDVMPEEEPARKSKGGLLLAGLGLLAGAGLGAGGMFALSGNGGGGGGGTKNDPAMVAQLNTAKEQESLARKTMEELQQKFAPLETQVDTLKKQAEDATNNLKSAEAAKLAAEKNLAVAKAAKDADLAKAKRDAEMAAAKKFEEEKATLNAAVTKATDDSKAAMMLATKVEKDLQTKTTELDAAKSLAEAAAAKLKSTDALLDPIIDKMKSAKLIDEKADRATAIKELPNAVKKANLISGDGDAAKLATDLSKLRDELTATKKDADSKVKEAEDKLATAKKDTEKLLADAKTASEKAMADLQTKVETADTRLKDAVAKAVTDAKKEAETMVATAKKEATDRATQAQLDVEREKTARATEAKQFEAKTATLTEQFEKQIAAARTGASVPLSTSAANKVVDASTSYDAGTTAYFANRFNDAELHFASATKSDESDARYWYYLGLSKYAQGRSIEAAEDFKKGAELEGRAKPGRRAVSSSLERVQGSVRQMIEAVRP